MYSVTVSDWAVGVGIVGVDVGVAITTVEGGVIVGILITGVGGRGTSVGQGVGVTKVNVIVGIAGMVGMAIRVGLMGREGHVGVGVGASPVDVAKATTVCRASLLMGTMPDGVDVGSSAICAFAVLAGGIVPLGSGALVTTLERGKWHCRLHHLYIRRMPPGS